MSTIEVKGSRPSNAPEPVSRQTFEFEESEKKSKLPLVFGLAITAIIGYLKSAVPIFGHGELDERQLADGPAKADPAAQKPVDDDPEGKIEEKAQNTVHPVQQFPGDGPHLPQIVHWRAHAYVNDDSISFGGFSPVELPQFPRGRSGPANDNTPSSPGLPQSVSPPVDGSRDVPGEESVTDHDEETPDTPEPPDITDDPDRKNRAPVSAGGVRLNDVMAGQVVLIGLSELLANMDDPDGDAIGVKNVRVSAGSIGQSAEGWIYSSNRQTADQEVTITYDVTDGEAVVTLTAVLRIEGKVPIVGTEGDDLLAGLTTADQIDAAGGDDIVDAKGGDDFIRGGAGDDHIMGDAGNDTIDAGAGNDVVFAGAGNDFLIGGAGNDRLYGEAGNDVLSGDEGDDIMDGGEGHDNLHGGDGNDKLAGEHGNDTINAGAGNDRVSGGDGNDLVEDGIGVDIVEAGAGNDIMFVSPDRDIDRYDGGTGMDTVDLTQSSEDMQVDFSLGTISGPGPAPDAIIAVESVVLGGGNDTVVDAVGSQSALLGGGDDELIAAADGVSDTFDGGAGTDILDLSITQNGVEVDLNAGISSSVETGHDTVTCFEVVIAGSGDDVLTDGITEETFFAGAGDDTVVATLDDADDCFAGGDGQDTLDLSNTTQGVVVDVAAGRSSGAEIGSDSAVGFEVVVGGSGDDCIVVDTNAATTGITLVGGAGDDSFQFEVDAGPAASNFEMIHQILDFMVGDQVFVADYEFRKIRGDNGAEKFERIYDNGGTGPGDDELIVRLRDNTTGNVQYAVIEVDRNRDDQFDFSVEIYGSSSSVQEQTLA